MKYLIALLIYSSMSFSADDQFIKEAKTLASDLKKSLMQNLTEKISKDGVAEAVPFLSCKC